MTDKDSDQTELPTINTKKLSFLFNIFIKSFPELCTFDTYREKEYARINTGDGYASDLDVYNQPIAEHCKVKKGSDIAALTFLSHTKKYSTSLPYAGKVRKTPRINKSHSTGSLKTLENLEYNFHLCT